MNFNITKRNGVAVEFNPQKIEKAIIKAACTVYKCTKEDLSSKFTNNVTKVAKAVTNIVEMKVDQGMVITVEFVQDCVEYQLMGKRLFDIAKEYIVYRDAHNKERKARATPDNSLIEDYIAISRYARYRDDLGRRETYEENVNRVRNMHLLRYPEVKDDINWAFDRVLEKRCLPSMRSMQFGGKAIETNHARMYNCTFGICDHLDFFKNGLYLLLCGTGVGFSVEFEHVEKLPELTQNINEDNVIHHTVADTIEGWADALKALIDSYVTGEYIEFNYSLIRDRGIHLKTSGGKAPGHIPISKGLNKIRNILNKSLGRRLKPIECYDIMMHAADAVIAGGVRRSATICLFSMDDGEMMNAKTGNWYNENPQRGRSNNSVKLIRGEATKAQFLRIFNKQKEWGEPGFYFASDIDHGANPCQPEFATVLTPQGIREFKDIDVGSEIWSETGWTKVIKKWSTGIKEVYKYTTSAGSFIGTDKHRIVSDSNKVEVGLAESIDVLQGVNVTNTDIVLQDVMDGLVFGDGSVHSQSKNQVFLCIGENDGDYFSSEIKPLLCGAHSARPPYSYNVRTTIKPQELGRVFDRKIPERFVKGDISKVCSFLRGLYSANGSVVSNRISLKATSLSVIEDVQIMLSSIGIRSYYTTNRPSEIEWGNGTYVSKESYDLNISTDRSKFQVLIGFLQLYKNDKVKEICKIKSCDKVKTSDIRDVDSLNFHKVYDITVDNESHTYWTGGLNVSNCVEIGLNPKLVVEDTISGDIEVHTGWQFCNLAEINGAKLKTLDDFKIAIDAATIIGTLQAGYTDFPYVGWVTEELCRNEALLGVSITGMMDSPNIALRPDYQRAMAKRAIKINKKISAKISTNSAARITCVKPAGSTSLLLGTASGIHPRHARRYFRRVQANKTDPVFKHLKANNPHMCEDSVWSTNHTDEVITFCIEAPEEAIVKSDMPALELLKYVHSTQKNWVIPGNAKPESNPGLNHNVSNTISVKDDEWDAVAEFIWDNQSDFTGVSLLHASGDKQYQQAPHEEVITPNDKHLWNELIGKFKPVDYTELIEGKDNTTLQSEAACAGGACEI